MHNSITLGGQYLHGVDRHGEWFVTGLEGWNEPPSVRSTDAERESSHGDHSGPATYAARTPTIDGYLLLDDHDAGYEAMLMLNAVASLTPELLTVVEGSRPMSAWAKLAGLDWTWEAYSAIRFQLRLKCDDPRKFGGYQSPVSLDPEGMVFHRGNTDSLPVVEVTGSAPSGYALVDDDGRRFEVRSPLAGSHTVDMSTGRAYENGVPVPRYGRAQIVHVRPGLPQRVRVEPLGAGTITATVTVQDTWI